MTPDQRFARWVQASLAGLAICFCYFLIADLIMPLTPQAQVTRTVIKVSPRVSGQVIDVPVINNQRVDIGDVLFQLDDAPFDLALQAAELDLEQAQQDTNTLDAGVSTAVAQLHAAQINAREQQQQLQRLRPLAAKGLVSTQQMDTQQTRWLAAQADVHSSQAYVSQLASQRGVRGNNNLRLRQAINTVEQAKLQKNYSTIRAEQSGVVSNVQLAAGTYLPAGVPVMALVSDDWDVIADFREKSLRHAKLGTPVRVVFDAWPGQVFEGEISELDAGVRDGQIEANGELATPAHSDRWVRDAQRQRVHIKMLTAPEQVLPAGAKATVQLLPEDYAGLSGLGRLQIRLVSWIHYVY